MLKLLIEETHAANPVLPVSWCVSEAIKDRFQKEEITSAYLFISAIITPPDNLKFNFEIKETDRILVPLVQGLAYLRFNRPGEHLIYAQIVVPYDSKNGGKHFEEHFFKPCFGGERYNLSVFRPELPKKVLLKGFFLHPELPGRAIDHAIEMVTVSEKFFAPEPPKWEKDWVLKFPRALNIPVLNQCHYRAWRIIAYSIQPFIFLSWYIIVTLLVLFFLSSGFWREVKIRNTLISGDLGEFFSYEERSDHNFFLKDKEFKRRSGLWFLLSPLWLFLLGISLWELSPYIAALQAGKFRLLSLSASIAFLFLLINSLSISILCLAVALKVLVGIVGKACRLILGSSELLKEEKLKLKNQRRLERLKLERERDEKQNQEKAQEIIKNLENVVCKSRSIPIKVSELPLTHRTIGLHFENIKAKVCKQFAR